jgi:hypothetical protein
MLGSLCFAADAPPAGANGGGGDGGAAVSASGTYEVGMHLGTLLPNQIGGVSEIMSLGGIRGGVRIAQQGWWESGLITGNGEGQTWRNIHTDIRMDIPYENLVGIAGVGLDIIQFSGPSTSSTLDFGGHVNLGVQANLGGSIWFRTDMKFGFSPGTSLYIGFGLTYRGGAGGP